MLNKIKGLALALLATGLMLGAGAAQADFSIAGEWFENRGPTVNIPPGIFDGPCGGAFTIAVASRPIATANQAPAPCVRHQLVGAGVALQQQPQFGVPGPAQVISAATSTPTAVGQTFVFPPNLFSRDATSMVGVPVNPIVQQLDTVFDFDGPVTIRTITPNNLNTPSFTPMMGGVGQRPGIPGQTRRLQASAWNGPGQTLRMGPNFAFSQFDGTGALGLTRQVVYTGGPNGFGGTMAMFLRGAGAVYVKSDLVTLVPGTEVLVSPLGGGPGNTQHQGRGYLTSQRRIGNNGPIYQNYVIPTPCVVPIPPTPVGCDLLTGISGFLASLPAATTVNIGFPWTTGHVSVYANGFLGGQPVTTTLSAVGSDTTSGGVRTIQLVAGGVSLRNSPTGLGRSAQFETVTIQVPEPGSTLALVGALGLIGGLYTARRRLL